MDRKNGGDFLAAVPPPRPPKSMPRVHRPRAPEPTLAVPSRTTFTNNNNNANNSLRQLQDSTATNRPNPILSQGGSSSNNHNNLIINISNISNQSATSNNNLSLNSNLSSSFSRRRPPPSSPFPQAPLTPTTTTTATTIIQPQPILNNNNSNLLTSPTSSSFPNPATPNSPVTLASPRPESERLANEYVDTPLRGPPTTNPLQPQLLQHTSTTTSSSSNNNNNINDIVTFDSNNFLSLLHQQQQQQTTQQQQQHHHHNHHQQQQIPSSTLHELFPHLISTTLQQHPTDDVDCESTTEFLHSNFSNKDNNISRTITRQQPQATITKQPTSATSSSSSPIINVSPATFSKDVSTISPLCHDDHGESTIVCPQCKRCRCEQCMKPRQLPSTWICKKTCFCSPESVIDYGSCLCCVKALFFHSENMKDAADDPCSCVPHRRVTRWGWLGALSFILPCLWCYWPMRGCMALCAKCYRQYAQQGCRCQHHQHIPTQSTIGGGGGGGGGGGVNNMMINSTNSNFSGEKRLLDTN